MVGKSRVKEVIYHLLVSFGALIMIYPLLWMVLSSFKPTDMVLPTAAQLIPTTWTLDNYIRGWKGFMGYTFGAFFSNSFFNLFIHSPRFIISNQIYQISSNPNKNEEK